MISWISFECFWPFDSFIEFDRWQAELLSRGDRLANFGLCLFDLVLDRLVAYNQVVKLADCECSRALLFVLVNEVFDVSPLFVGFCLLVLECLQSQMLLLLDQLSQDAFL